MSIDYVDDETKELRKHVLRANADFEASQRKFSEVVNFLGECHYKELIENPKTGEPFFHLLTKNGEEAIVELRYIIDCFKGCRENCKKLGDYHNKTIDKINQTTLAISKTYLEEIKKIKELTGTS